MSENAKKEKRTVVRQHMRVHWHDIVRSESDIPAVNALLKEKTSIIGRIGSMFLAVGTSAWRIRNAMNNVARELGISCNANIGLVTLTYTCFSEGSHYSQTISLPNTGINTDKLMDLKLFVDNFHEYANKYSVEQLHQILDKIEAKKPNYKPWQLGLAAGFACFAFTSLLGGGPVEMICAFLGAGMGCFVRSLLIKSKINILMNVAVGVAVAYTVYVAAILAGEIIFGLPPTHHAGYICAMLFIIPGFPLITGGLDLAKLDIRSGVERLVYATMIIVVATFVGWATALIYRFNPADFPKIEMVWPVKMALRAVMSFIGVYGFSCMFNSTRRMACTAGIIGLIANVTRLTLGDIYGIHIAIGAFIGALIAGLLASIVNKRVGVPRISLTVPSIVIMVPGLFMYKAVYFIGLNNISEGGVWLTSALLTVIALPMGLVFARVLTDVDFRHCS